MDDLERRQQFERLFAAHAAAVRAYARRRVEAAVADDVTSEVFVVAWRRLEDVPDDSLPWLLGCARRVLWHQYRRSKRDAALLERLHAAMARSRPSGDHVLADALGKLNDGDRELLLLVAWEGLAISQAAKVLGCSRNTASVRAYRARKRLAAALDRPDHFGEHPESRPAVEEGVLNG